MFCAFFFFCDGLVVVVQDLEEHERGHLGKNLDIDETKANKCQKETHDEILLKRLQRPCWRRSPEGGSGLRVLL